MIAESEIIPYHVSLPPGGRVLVLAPHPDDETLGCGGAIRLYTESKKKVKVVFLTSGDKADPANRLSQRVRGDMHITDYSLMREKEAEDALRVLGVSDYAFLRFPDRELAEHSSAVENMLMQAAEDFQPDIIFSPSVIELNPDHRATAYLSMELQRNISHANVMVGLAFYEVSTPLRPNMLLDISAVFGRKKKAAIKYRSQLKLIDYLGHMTALNTLRSLTVRGADHVEAVWFSAQPQSEDQMKRWLGYLDIIAPSIASQQN